MKMNLETLTSILADEFGDGSDELGDLLEMARDESAGICLACHSITYGVEPDARRYECEECGEPRVYGIEEVSMMVAGY